MKQSIAVIGLGAMGLPMAERLLQAGFEVRGTDIAAAALEALVACRGTPATTPASAVDGADAVLLAVVNADQAERALFGDNGAAKALKPHCVVISAVTMAPQRAATLAERLAAQGIALLDAPVSGGVKGATQGSLTVVASGSDEAFEKAQPVLGAISARVFRVGTRPGDASTVKLLNQILCGIHLAATAEVMALAERLGIAPETVYDVVTASSGSSRMFEDRAPDMRGTPPPVKASVGIFVKDLGLAGDLADSVRAAHPLAQAARTLFTQAAASGLESGNDSEVVQVLRRAEHAVQPETL